MNKEQRKLIDSYISKLESIKDGIAQMQSDEDEKYENLPESIQESERGQAIYMAAENLDSAATSLEDVIAQLYEAMD